MRDTATPRRSRGHNRTGLLHRGPLALLLGVPVAILPVAARAQAADLAAYCEVEDRGNREVWVSQVFPTTRRPGDTILNESLATEFHDYVATLGGSGDKSCLVASRDAVESNRAQIAEIFGKRTFGIRVYKWHDVAWTPRPVNPDAPSAPIDPMPAQFVYCRAIAQEARKIWTSQVFATRLPRADNLARYRTLERWAREFASQAGLGTGDGLASCLPADTAAEADKSLEDFLKGFRFTGVSRAEIAWAASGPDSPDATAAVAPPAAKTSAAPALASKGRTTDATSAAPTRTPPRARIPAGPDDIESDFWNRIRTSQQAADFDDYLAAFPEGRHAPIARLEARRLHASGNNAPGASASAPAPMPTPAMPPPPIDDAVSHRLNAEPTLRPPAGGSGTLAQEGELGNRHMTAAATRLPNSDVCHVTNTVRTDTVETHYDGYAWAGFVALAGTMDSKSAYGSTHLEMRTSDFSELRGQVFPLVEGKSFAFRRKEKISVGTGNPIMSDTLTECVVGATRPASGVVAGATGEVNPVQCTLSIAGVKPMPFGMQWFSSVGCFVYDPNR